MSSEEDPAETTADSDGSDSIQDIQTVVVDPEDVVEALAHNGHSGDMATGKAVFSLVPPFEPRVELSIHYLGNDTSDDAVGDRYHIRPLRFVEEGKAVLAQRPTHATARDHIGEDADRRTLQEWTDAALQKWKAHVRDNLVDQIDIYADHGLAVVDVVYENPERP